MREWYADKWGNAVNGFNYQRICTCNKSVIEGLIPEENRWGTPLRLVGEEWHIGVNKMTINIKYSELDNWKVGTWKLNTKEMTNDLEMSCSKLRMALRKSDRNKTMWE